MSTDAKAVKFDDDSYPCIQGVISRPDGAELLIREMINLCHLHGFILNPSKSSEMIMPLSAQAGLATQDAVFGIPRTVSMKILGIHVQCNLKFDTHIAEYTVRACRNLYLLTRLKHYSLKSKEIEMLFSALVLSVRTYRITVWGGSASCLLEKIDTVQRRAKRFGIISSWRPIKDHIREADQILLQKIRGQHLLQEILTQRTEYSQERQTEIAN